MNRAFTILVFLRNDDGFYARVEEYKGCFAYGETLKELFERLQAAIKLSLEAEEEIKK